MIQYKIEERKRQRPEENLASAGIRTARRKNERKQEKNFGENISIYRDGDVYPTQSRCRSRYVHGIMCYRVLFPVYGSVRDTIQGHVWRQR